MAPKFSQHRRCFLKSLISLPGALSTFPTVTFNQNSVTQGQNFYDTTTLLQMFNKDKVDISPNYLHKWPDEQHWHDIIDNFITHTMSHLEIPDGWIVEIGTYKAHSFQKLCNKYGADRCLGFDVYPYSPHPNIINADIRTIKQKYDRPIAFGWSNASNWEGSPRSKIAALEYLKRNIVKNGFLLEDSLPDIPHNITFPGYQIVWQNQTLVLLQRTS